MAANAAGRGRDQAHARRLKESSGDDAPSCTALDATLCLTTFGWNGASRPSRRFGGRPARELRVALDLHAFVCCRLERDDERDLLPLVVRQPGLTSDTARAQFLLGERRSPGDRVVDADRRVLLRRFPNGLAAASKTSTRFLVEGRTRPAMIAVRALIAVLWPLLQVRLDFCAFWNALASAGQALRARRSSVHPILPIRIGDVAHVPMRNLRVG